MSRQAERAGFLTTAAVILLALNMRTVIASLPPLLHDVRHDLGLSATLAGLLTTLPVLCFGAFATVVPRVARRFPMEPTLAACAAVTALAAAGRGIGTVPALFLASTVAGISVAIGQALLPVLIRTRWPAATGRLIGAYSMSLPLGATLASALSVPLAKALGDSWERSLASWAILAAFAAAVWAAMARRTTTLLHGPAPAPLRAHGRAWAVAAYFGVQSAAFYAGLSWLPEILHAHGFSESTAGDFQAVNALFSMAPALAVPIVAGRMYSQRPLLLVIVATATTGVVGLLAAPGAGLLWVALIGLGQGGQLGLALILPVVRARSTGAVAALTAMTYSVGYLIAASGPWLLGVAHDVSGHWTAPVAVLLGITLLQLVPGLVACRPGTVDPE